MKPSDIFLDAMYGHKSSGMKFLPDGTPIAFAFPDRKKTLWTMEGIFGWEAVTEVERHLEKAGYGSYEVVRNRAECPLCGELIESQHRHDYRSCGCGNVSVDGGRDYLRHGWRDAMPIQRSEIRWTYCAEV